MKTSAVLLVLNTLHQAVTRVGGELDRRHAHFKFVGYVWTFHALCSDEKLPYGVLGWVLSLPGGKPAATATLGDHQQDGEPCQAGQMRPFGQEQVRGHPDVELNVGLEVARAARASDSTCIDRGRNWIVVS